MKMICFKLHSLKDSFDSTSQLFLSAMTMQTMIAAGNTSHALNHCLHVHMDGWESYEVGDIHLEFLLRRVKGLIDH